MSATGFIGRKLMMLNIAASAIVNVIIVVLYFRFLWEAYGAKGILLTYAISAIICIAILLFRAKKKFVDVTLGAATLVSFIYAMLVVMSYHLLAVIMMVCCIVMSVSFRYFDWGYARKSTEDYFPTLFGFDLSRFAKRNQDNH